MKPHPPDQQHPNAVLYCHLMEQLKWRLDAVQKTLALIRAGQYYLPNLPGAEFCLLQLRKVCELIALGCIAVHTDVPQTRKLQREWNAERIMKAFDRLKPEYFPIPAEDVTLPNGVYDLREKKRLLNSRDLRKMYSFFGQQLHAGNFDDYQNPTFKNYDFQTLDQFVTDITETLNTHIYKIYGDQRLVRVMECGRRSRLVERTEQDLIPGILARHRG